MAEKKGERKKTADKKTVPAQRRSPSRTRKTPVRRKTRRRKKFHPEPVIIGLLLVIIILMTVFFFIIPQIKNEGRLANTPQTQVNPTPTTPAPQPPIIPPQPDVESKTESNTEAPSSGTSKTQKPPKKKPHPPRVPPARPDPAPAPAPAPAPEPQTTPAPAENPLPDLPKKGTLVFVFDDAGHNLQHLQLFLDLPFPCAIAVLPRLPDSVTAVRRIRAAGKEAMLHQPMQPLNNSIDPGEGAVLQNMSTEQIKSIVRKNIDDLAPLAGMNNHEGSLITADKKAMKAVLEVAKEKNIFFLDSRTNADTVVPQVAKQLNMTIWERAIFIDNNADYNAMKAQIVQGVKIAEQHGYVIMIGHVFTTELARLLTDMYPDFTAAGFTLSTITDLDQQGY